MAPEKGRRKTKLRKKASRMASPRLGPCPSGCGYSLSVTDTHEACPVCLGFLHAKTALESPDSCSHCCRLSAVVRKRRMDKLAKAMGKAVVLEVARDMGLPAPEPELDSMDLECSGQVRDDNVSDSSAPLEDSTHREGSLNSSQNLAQVLPEPDVSVPALFDLYHRAVNALQVAWPNLTPHQKVTRLAGSSFYAKQQPTTSQKMPIFPDFHMELTRSWAEPGAHMTLPLRLEDLSF